MPTSFFGLPVHPLVVHATVVVVPAAALAVLLAALWPRFRSWAGWGPLALAVLGLALVPLSTSSGENLEHQLPHTALIEAHTRLADGLLPWMIGLVVVGAAVYAVHRRPGLAGIGPLVAIAVLAVVAALGTTVQLARIGHSGAKSAWAKVDSQAQGG